MPPFSTAEMTSFYTAFRADDTLIHVLPNFDYASTLPLSSSVPAGPFKAGISTAVPLWMALFLQQRSLATISPPSWLNTENLASIIKYEKREGSLFDDETKLPANYYEIAKRLTAGANKIENSDAIALLVQDLLEIRIDKLRQQFQTLLTDTVDTDLTVAVNGIGTQELAILRAFVTRALADQHFLAADNSNKTESTTANTADNAAQEAKQQQQQPAALPKPSRFKTRRFRS